MRWLEQMLGSMSGKPASATPAVRKGKKAPLALELDSLQNALKPFFSGLGFRQKGRHYNRLSDDGLVQAVTFWIPPRQTPVWGYAPGSEVLPQGHFSLSFGVYIPEVWEAQDPDGYVPLTFVTEPHCELRFMFGSSDVSYEEITIRNDDATRRAVMEAIERSALPFFAAYATRDQILEEMQDQESSTYTLRPAVVCACIAWRRGDKDAAREFLRGQARRAKDEGHPHYQFVVGLAEKMGLGPLGV